MDLHGRRLDWNHVRSFLAISEAGSLSAAARELGLTQPTLGRQLAALERELGVALFERIGRGLSPTPTAQALLEHARPMGEAAGRLALAANGRSQVIEGPIRITASEVYAAHVLPPVIAALRSAYPGISVEIIATNRAADLLRREADIAIRNFATTEPELIARKVAEDRGRPYATPDCITRLKHPRGWTDLAATDFVGVGDAAAFVEGLRRFGIEGAAPLMVQADSHEVHWALVRQGLGVGFTTETIGDAEPAVRRVLPDIAPVIFPVWLATHRELHTSRRVRVVFDLLAEALSRRA